MTRRVDPAGLPLPRKSEHEEQAAVIAWAELQEAAHPDLALLFAVPNMAQAPRNKAARVAVARRLREGMKPGAPDLFLPVARGPYIGCAVEMKHRRVHYTQTKGMRYEETDTTPAQEEFHRRLRAAGHYVAVRHSAEEAQAVFLAYLTDPDSLAPQDGSAP